MSNREAEKRYAMVVGIVGLIAGAFFSSWVTKNYGCPDCPDPVEYVSPLLADSIAVLNGALADDAFWCEDSVVWLAGELEYLTLVLIEELEYQADLIAAVDRVFEGKDTCAIGHIRPNKRGVQWYLIERHWQQIKDRRR